MRGLSQSGGTATAISARYPRVTSNSVASIWSYVAVHWREEEYYYPALSDVHFGGLGVP